MNSKSLPKETTLNLHPEGKEYKNNLRASTANLIVDPYIDPLLSIKK
jgi:hypothetical protein